MAQGRKKEFDVDKALEDMMYVFWEKGFEGASYDDLVKGTGVQRSGLYSAFGDKESAFLKCLDHYLVNITKRFMQPLRQDNAGLEQLRTYFDVVIDFCKSDQAWGCLMCNTMSAKIMDQNPKVKDMIEYKIDYMRESFLMLLKSAQKKKQIAKDMSLKEEAN